MKLAILYAVLLSSIICGVSDYISYKAVKNLDNESAVIVGYPALKDCKNDKLCSDACNKALKIGVIKSSSECEY